MSVEPRVVVHENPGSFLASAQPLLLHNEAEYSLMLGVAQGLPPQATEPLCATVEDDTEVLVAALCTPPYKLMLTDGSPQAIDRLRQRIVEIAPNLTGVVGPADAAGHFARGWPSPARPGLQMTLHRLVEVADVPTPPGRVRTATIDDQARLLPWAQQFVDQSGSDDPRPAAEVIAPYLAAGTLHLWEDGAAVSMAGWSRGTAHGASISMVFTPPEHRGRGYATALTAHLSQWLLSQGKRFCVLFTNRAHPATAAIYARVGYEPLQEHDGWSFDAS